MTTEIAKTPAPPYIPFKTLSNWLEKIEPKALPPQIDKSLLTTMAGGQRLPFMATLAWLGLVGETGNRLPTRQQIVVAKTADERKALLKAIIESRYPWVTPLTAQNATLAQLEQSFSEKGPSGSTLRKCIVFYLQAAAYCGIPVSPHFKVRGYISRVGRASNRQGSTRQRATDELPAPAVNKTTAPQTTTAGDLKIRYIEMLMKKADEKDDPELLDRIEKLLGAAMKETE